MHAKPNSPSSFPSFRSPKEAQDKAVWESEVLTLHNQILQGGNAKRESSVGRSCLFFALASGYSCPTQNSSKVNIGQEGT